MNQSILKKLIDFSIVTLYQPQPINYSDLPVMKRSQDTNQVSPIESIHEHVLKPTEKAPE